MEYKFLKAKVIINEDPARVWEHWITPEDIMCWNIPFEDWHCPKAENEVKNGGSFNFRMKKKDGSEGFDHKGKYDKVKPLKSIESTQEDGRKTIIEFSFKEGKTVVTEYFEPENDTHTDVQQDFCQSVLNRFKKYVEENGI